MVDQPFLTWQWPITGGSTNRSMPDRLNEHLNVKEFGAVGDGAADDTVAIQSAIDYALSNHRYSVYMPEGQYKTSDTLHLGYGWIGGAANFNTIELVGASGWPLSISEAYQGYTLIRPTFTDRPVINIQGGRLSGVRNISIIGPTAIPITDFTISLATRANASNYIPTGGKDDVNAPFCGICIDGYAGTAPASPYPTPTYPAWVLPSASAYGKGLSSECFIINCHIFNTLIGIMVQPNLDGNGDFCKFNNCFFSTLKVGIAWGNDQARTNDVSSTIFAQCHTCFDSVTYGPTDGNMGGNWTNIAIDHCYQIIKGKPPQTYPLSISNSYCESTMRLGEMRGDPTGAVSWRNCEFFVTNTIFASSVVTEFYRETMFDGNGVFDGCRFMGSPVYHFTESARFDDCSFEYPTTDPAFDVGANSSIPLLSMNAFGQVFFDTQRPPFSNTYLILNARGHTEVPVVPHQRYDGFDNYNAGVCIWSEGSETIPGNLPNNMRWNYDFSPMYVVGAIGFSSVPNISSNTMTFNPAGGETFYRPGDVLHFVPNGMWWYVVSQSSVAPLTVTTRALSDTALSTGGSYSILNSSPLGGTYQYYYPINMLDCDPGAMSSPLFMTTTSSSNLVRFVDATGALSSTPALLSTNSKVLWIGKDAAATGNTVPFPANTTVTSISSASITMGSNALLDGTWAYAPGIKRVK